MTVILGSTVKDKISGFTGVVTGYVQYLTGCNQALVVPPVDEKGAFREGQWYDVQRLEQQDAPVIVLENGENPGADTPAPKQ